MKPSKLLGKMGDENFKVENCPVALPKENIKFFRYMQKESDHDPYDNYQQYGNAYREDWHKPAKYDSKFAIKVMEAIDNGIKNALNESFVNKDIELECLNDIFDFYNEDVIDLSKEDLLIEGTDGIVYHISWMTKDPNGKIIFLTGDVEDEKVVPITESDYIRISNKLCK